MFAGKVFESSVQLSTSAHDQSQEGSGLQTSSSAVPGGSRLCRWLTQAAFTRKLDKLTRAPWRVWCLWDLGGMLCKSIGLSPVSRNARMSSRRGRNEGFPWLRPGRRLRRLPWKRPGSWVVIIAVKAAVRDWDPRSQVNDCASRWPQPGGLSTARWLTSLKPPAGPMLWPAVLPLHRSLTRACRLFPTGRGVGPWRGPWRRDRV